VVHRADRKLSRKEREKLRHRREILEAAEQLFSDRGYHGTSVQDIADAAEFSVGALYNIFKSKEDLYSQLIQMRANEYYQTACGRIDRARGPLEKIKAAISTKLDFFKQHRQFFGIFAGLPSENRSERPPLMSEECQRIYHEYQAHLRNIFQEGIEMGIFADRPPLLMVLFLEGGTNAIIGRWVHVRDQELEDVPARDIESILLRGVLAGGNG